MSNNLVSQPLMIPNQEINPIPKNLEVVPTTSAFGGMSSSPRGQQFDASNKQMGLVQPMSNNFGVNYNSSPMNQHIGHRDMKMSQIGVPQYTNPSQHGSPKISLPIKRTAAGEHIVGNSVGQQLMTPNKYTAKVEPLSNKPGVQQQVSKPAPNKKFARNESISGRSGSKQAQTPKSRTVQMEPSPKNQGETNESVRSKMRESLASALALVTEQNTEASRNDSNPSGDSVVKSEKESVYAAYFVPSNDGMGDSAQGVKNDESRFQYATSALSGEEFPFTDNFFVQDELLQGNGLTWAMDLSGNVEESKEVGSKKPKLEEQHASKVGKEEALSSPESLASKIEAELFKLFGGVNKKYKEKGRSLLFNLKDRNNPELREKVMSGDISPERLCAMSAEELASKELSEWRTAKAEELAQMVVLPDTDVDIRRLVRKTHKGEIQVEFEQDDGVSVEVSTGASVIARPKQENKGDNSSSKVDKSKENSQDILSSLTITNDAAEADFMQGLMSDEFKDAEFLPPIVSLDEFMQSLDTEPPFENLQADGEKTGSPSAKESPEGGDHMITADKASKEPTEVSAKVESEPVDTAETKPKHGLEKERVSSPGAAKMGEQLWEGLLQLNVSAGVNAVGYFRSGEKTSAKEWPALLEIKGRVRLDAFEKFIQGLPMSRSRAVMVAHFALKDDSSDADHATLGDAVHSYIMDERLGISEPIPGVVEIYFCPPNPKIVEMLYKHLSKSLSDNIKSIEKGLIGVVVWRRVSTNISPNSTSHHKHISKKPHLFTSATSNVSNNMSNVKSTHNHQMAPQVKPPPSHRVDDEDDDDIPPGFGPASARSRDEDDLPEFNFSGGQMHKQNVPNSRPVDQMRALVLKYGQSGNSNNNDHTNNSRLGTKRWNEDDEDDIPEWQPGHQLVMNPHGFQQQSWVQLQANSMVQPGGGLVNQPLQPPGMIQRQNPGANLGGQVYGGQIYPRTRGF